MIKKIGDETLDQNGYSAKDITIYEKAEGIRKRCAMYIGDPINAVYQMILETVDNAVDEFLAGYCNKIYVELGPDFFVVEDNGRGIPVDIHPLKKIPAIELIMTTFHSGAKFDSKTYKFSAGVHGLGLFVTNALCSLTEVQVYRDNLTYYITFEKGELKHPLTILGSSEKYGTRIKAWPDFSVLPPQWPNAEVLSNRLNEISFLNSGLEIIFQTDGKTRVFKSDLLSHVKSLISKEGEEGPIISIHKEQIDCVFGWSERDEENIDCYTNGTKQNEGGTHLIGFKNAINRAIQGFLEKQKKKVHLSSEDVRNGLVAVLSVKWSEPAYASQTKNKLVTPEVRSFVENTVFQNFSSWLEENPKLSSKILEIMILSSKKREAFLRVKDVIKKTAHSDFKLLGKFWDCTKKDPKQIEFLILEGDSAGGAAKLGRNIQDQAIFPLTGKILNTARATLASALKFDEICSLIAALGTKIGKEFDINKLRYHKIIILVDADFDGYHILCLLAMFFAKFMPQLFQGHIFLGQPPLFRVAISNKYIYLKNNEELESFILDKIWSLGFSKRGIPMEKEEVQILIQKCRELVNYLNKNLSVVPNEIMALFLAHGVDFFYLLEGESIIEICNKKLKLYNQTDYGLMIYNFDLQQTKYLIPQLPLEIGNSEATTKVIYSPIFLLEIINNKSKDLRITRFKGLGEMNENELYDSCLDKNNRILRRLDIPEDRAEEVMARLLEFLGQENERRPFILKEIENLFNIKFD